MALFGFSPCRQGSLEKTKLAPGSCEKTQMPDLRNLFFKDYYFFIYLFNIFYKCASLPNFEYNELLQSKISSGTNFIVKFKWVHIKFKTNSDPTRFPVEIHQHHLAVIFLNTELKSRYSCSQ